MHYYLWILDKKWVFVSNTAWDTFLRKGSLLFNPHSDLTEWPAIYLAVLTDGQNVTCGSIHISPKEHLGSKFKHKGEDNRIRQWPSISAGWHGSSCCCLPSFLQPVQGRGGAFKTRLTLLAICPSVKKQWPKGSFTLFFFHAGLTCLLVQEAWLQHCSSVLLFQRRIQAW